MQKHCVLLREGSLSYLRQEDDAPHQHTMIFLILHSWKRHSWGTAAHTECENSNSSTHNLFSSVRDNKSYEYTIAIVQKPCQKPSQVFIPSCSDLNRNNCVLFLLFCKNICRLHNQYSRNYSIEICNNEIYTSKFHLQIQNEVLQERLGRCRSEYAYEPEGHSCHLRKDSQFHASLARAPHVESVDRQS